MPVEEDHSQTRIFDSILMVQALYLNSQLTNGKIILHVIFCEKNNLIFT